MNHLMAKTKGKVHYYVKVMSGAQLFQLPTDLANVVHYTSSYKLEEDEWFVVTDFSLQEYCIPLLSRPLVSLEYSQVAPENYHQLEWLCSCQETHFFFQKVAPSQLVKKRFLSLSDAPELFDGTRMIVIPEQPDAIYDRATDTLYFKHLATISSIFRGIDSLFREATQEETNEFLQQSFIKLGNGYSTLKVKTANRKRIAMAMETLTAMSQSDQTSVFEYIQGYCEDLRHDKVEGFFVVTSEDDLKRLLYGIEQRYYTTPIGQEKRVANSVRKLS